MATKIGERTFCTFFNAATAVYELLFMWTSSSTSYPTYCGLHVLVTCAMVALHSFVLRRSVMHRPQRRSFYVVHRTGDWRSLFCCNTHRYLQAFLDLLHAALVMRLGKDQLADLEGELLRRSLRYLYLHHCTCWLNCGGLRTLCCQ